MIPGQGRGACRFSALRRSAHAPNVLLRFGHRGPGHSAEMASRFLFLTPQMVPALATWARGVGLARKLSSALTVAAILSVLATSGAIIGVPPFGPNPSTVFWLVIFNLVLCLPLGVIVAKRLVEVWVERRRGLAGSRLHVQVVGLFGMLAGTPAVGLAVFSAGSLNLTPQGLFGAPGRDLGATSGAGAQA